jgi:HAD superfamily hydrolase (TIGR01509 family)
LQQAKIPLALVSNATGPVDIFDDDLRHKGLASFFQTVVWSSAVGYRKPHPRIFQAALAGLGLSASPAILMVGDHEQADVLGGNNMGFTTIKVVNSEGGTNSAADYVVARAALPDFFGRLNGGRGVDSNRM